MTVGLLVPVVIALTCLGSLVTIGVATGETVTGADVTMTIIMWGIVGAVALPLFVLLRRLVQRRPEPGA